MTADDAQTTSTRPLSFIERQKEAALAAISEQTAERRRIADIVLGDNHRGQRYVTDVVRLGDDHLVEVTENGKTLWTFVVNGKRVSDYHHTQEDAILHLIASRYDPNPNSNHAAAFYAGRVLGIPARN